MSEDHYGLSIEEIKDKLAYDSNTGIFYWTSPVSRNVPAGSEAGCEKATRTGKDGKKVSYRYIRYNGASIPSAKLAWALYYGEWPDSRICFKDNDTLNLRIENLYQTNGLSSKKDFSPEDRKEYLKSHRNEHPAAWKDSYLSRKYGINFNDFIAMAIAQENKCAICGEEEKGMRNGKVKTLSVDHNHTTGKVRELLCEACNKAIGLVKEDKNILLSAVRYLEKHLKSETNNL